jgi:hypothetical protein
MLLQSTWKILATLSVFNFTRTLKEKDNSSNLPN